MTFPANMQMIVTAMPSKATYLCATYIYAVVFPEDRFSLDEAKVE